MTSWIRAPMPKPREQGRGLFFETAEAGFCSNFNQFLYAYLYSLAENKALNVYDRTNPVSFNYPLIKNTFVDISGVNYTDGMMAMTNSTKKLAIQIRLSAENRAIEDVRTTAQRIFQWNPALIKTLEPILKGAKLPPSFDVGVHIRAGDKITTKEMRAILVDEYIRAVRKIQGTKKTLNVFLMSDSVTRMGEFIKKADPSWKVFTLSTPLLNADGHVQNGFNSGSPTNRMTAYRYFMAELLVMQSIPDIVCTFSSHVGRFLYLTVEHPERVVSLDVPKFSVG